MYSTTVQYSTDISLFGTIVEPVLYKHKYTCTSTQVEPGQFVYCTYVYCNNEAKTLRRLLSESPRNSVQIKRKKKLRNLRYHSMCIQCEIVKKGIYQM